MKASRMENAKKELKSLKKLYKKLLKSGNGWTLNQIDEMDIHFYLELFSEKDEEETVYIDQLRLI